MLTGVEVAGLVLAVLPLCITMIEHYEDEIEPFANLFSYSTRLSTRRKDLYCVHASFTKTIQNLCHNASVADSEQFDEMVKKAEPWVNNDESERKLRQFLGLQSHQAYRFEAITICDNIMKVAGILGLDEKGLLRMEGMQGFQSDPWKGVTTAKLQLQPPSQLTQSPHALRKRVKFIFKGGKIGPLLQKIKEGTRELDALIEKSISLHAIPVCVTIRKQKEPFSRPLEEIKDHACRLHRALHSVWSCPDHQIHRVNLRLERRARRDDDKKADQAHFTIALMPSQEWRSFEVNVGEEPATGRVNFQKPPTVPSGLSVIQDLCNHGGCLSLHLDHQDQIFGDPAIPATVSTDTTPCTTMTLKDLLTTTMRLETREKQRIQLALTLVSSFVQLQSTPWLPTCWCTEDVILLRRNTVLDVERPFICQLYPPNSCLLGSRPSDNDRIFALGTVLLQIATQKPIEEWRMAGNTSLEDLTIMRKCLSKEAQWWSPCFADAINACWGLLVRVNLDLNEPDMRKEVIEKMLYPFQRDLRW
ncbi:hypothetical protein Q7P37_007486 [Cladosporium fusiforme]